jgi:RNA recognition motif-containing protein
MQSVATTKKLLIGNLPEAVHTTNIHDLFKGVGAVISVAVLPHGFAFVEMKAEDADRALTQLNGYRWDGRTMLIDEAHPRHRSRY